MYSSIQIYIKYVDSRLICMEKYYTVVKKAARIAILFLSLASCVKLGNLFFYLCFSYIICKMRLMIIRFTTAYCSED